MSTWKGHEDHTVISVGETQYTQASRVCFDCAVAELTLKKPMKRIMLTLHIGENVTIEERAKR